MYIFLDCSLFRLGGRCIISSVFSTFLRLLSFRSFIYSELVHELLSERCLHSQESAANGTVTDEESPGINGDCVPESAGYYTSRLYPQTRRGRKSWSRMHVKQYDWHRQVILDSFRLRSDIQACQNGHAHTQRRMVEKTRKTLVYALWQGIGIQTCDPVLLCVNARHDS